MPNTFCSGNVLEVPQGSTMEEEVERRRVVARQVIEALVASDDLEGEDRAAFVRGKLEEIERTNR
jgi:hypothetical protein